MSQVIRWPAPAKLNLFLHVTGRRADGYHELQTVFQFLGHADHLWLQSRDDGQIRLLTPLAGVAPEDDLTVRAARLLQQAADCRYGVDISIDKQLPMGGGLGGGSSDAATVLVALNHVWQLGLSLGWLAEIGLELGADVPVFVRGEAAWAEGVGEHLKSMPDLPEPWYVVISPPCHVSTVEIFSDSQLTRDTKPIKIAHFLAGAGKNDCEAVACRRYPVIAEVLAWLGQFGSARMTGTGACVFVALNSQNEADVILGQIPNGWQGFVARGLNRSPLHSVLNSVVDR